MKRLFSQLFKHAIVLLLGLASTFSARAMEQEPVSGNDDCSQTTKLLQKKSKKKTSTWNEHYQCMLDDDSEEEESDSNVQPIDLSYQTTQSVEQKDGENELVVGDTGQADVSQEEKENKLEEESGDEFEIQKDDKNGLNDTDQQSENDNALEENSGDNSEEKSGDDTQQNDSKKQKATDSRQAKTNVFISFFKKLREPLPLFGVACLGVVAMAAYLYFKYLKS